MTNVRLVDAFDGCGALALGFVEKVTGLKAVADVYKAFEQTMATEFGFDFFIMAQVPARREMPRVMLSKAPIGWTEHYLANGFQQIDPVLACCRVASQPFGWADLAAGGEVPASSRHFMNLAREFGLGEGITIPIHNVDGTTTCASLSAANPYLNRFTQPAIHLMTIYAHEQVRKLLAPAIETEPGLTAREIEVLTWAAAGKSAAAIADILKISERTAIAHTLNATHKLGASNKTHAVALALKRRLISI